MKHKIIVSFFKIERLIKDRGAEICVLLVSIGLSGLPPVVHSDSIGILTYAVIIT